jgi:hypothetical protein
MRDCERSNVTGGRRSWLVGARCRLTCGAQPVVARHGVTTMEWFIFVFDKAHTLVKQCESQPNTPVGGGRFSCKAAGNMWATLTIKPQ